MLALFSSSVTLGGVAFAQTISPGELSRAHATLEGLRNCTECHAAAGKVSADRCLACHTELASRLTAGRGLHGRLSAEEKRACNRCHLEHQGRSFPLVDWGPAGREGFSHGQTGYPLAGKHATLACGSCHNKERIADPGVLAMLSQQGGRQTFLGLPTGCADCHRDAHHGQLEGACVDCHTQTAWKPAPGFRHGDTDFPLTGKHTRLACEKCHPRVSAAPPEAETFIQYRGIAHASCRDCHRDPHAGRLAGRCEDCHTTQSWLQVTGKAGRAFHEETRYPLRGAHVGVACARCHGPFPESPSRYKNMTFAACSDCHVDAHLGQLATAGAPPACESCHTVDGFLPPRYESARHASTPFPLTGAHRAVACNECHKRDPKLPAEHAAALRQAARRGRAVVVSDVRLRLAKELERCESCHEDPHGGQFAEGAAERTRGPGCQGCHETSSFTRLHFDHERDSRFSLAGKHTEVPCASCHPRERRDGRVIVRYRPLSTACESCHADVHLGQFADASDHTDCGTCHDVRGFSPAKFDHNDPSVSHFPLDGAHAQRDCGACHPNIAVAKGMSVRRYAGVPTTCSACHVDVHAGPLGPALPPALRQRKGSAAGSDRASAATAVKATSDCDGCHTTRDWQAVRFDHDATGFSLQGRHREVRCRMCHNEGFDRGTPARCAGCHRDAHANEFGQVCEGCHDSSSWRPLFVPDAHRRTVFPLVGRHAIIPCTECHQQRRDRGFGRASVQCFDCHETDYLRAASTSIDHVAAGFGTKCQDCHSPWAFSPARFAAHEVCFSLRGPPHGNIACRGCHTSLTHIQVTGACATNTASCSSCHRHVCSRSDREHTNVAGYLCADRRCYECHRFVQ